MSKYSQVFFEKISSLSSLIFGENNSRLDFLLERFFLLTPRKRTSIILATIFVSLTLFVLVVFMYFKGLSSLQHDLNSAYSAKFYLENLKEPYTIIQNEFKKSIDNLESKNKNISLSKELDQLAADVGLSTPITIINDVNTELPGKHPLYPKFQKEKMKIKISNASLKKIIEYINIINSADNEYTISEIEIQQIYGTKLYFDLLLSVEVFLPVNR